MVRKVSKCFKLEFDDVHMVIEEPSENDYGVVMLAKENDDGSLEIVHRNYSDDCVDFFIKIIKHVSDLEAKLADKDEILKATNESLYASREYLDKLKSEKWDLERKLVEKDEQMRTRIDVYEKQFVEISDELYQLRLKFAEKNNLLKQAQNLVVMHDDEQIMKDKIQFCIGHLENARNSILDFSNGYWRYFAKNGEEYMKSSDLESCLEEYIDDKIKQLKVLCDG